ncbi:MAG: hypothetical protein KA165_03575 [Saprospiraceae bacterium]|nr:hypothetical protein [Saprospiraceae bacterium]
MRNTTIYLSIFCAILTLLFSACKTEPDAWSVFSACATNACVQEAVAVEEALLKDPESMLAKFDLAYQKGEDHVIGWLYILRDSVLLNPAYASVEVRLNMQQTLVSAANPLANDPKLGEMAHLVLNEIGTLAITAEPAPTEAQDAAILQGDWVSTVDARSEISLKKGMFTETYGGEQMSRFPYQYFAQCPNDCNPAADVPCIKVAAQDNVCYVVVKADGKTLELSPIGGTGNTLVYRRK